MPPKDRQPQRAVDEELKAVRNRELELKRLQGEISCAECRRVKLKCDKQVPCTPCKRKGFEDICPIGTSVGPASNNLPSVRPLFAEIGTLDAARAKLIAMSLRIRELEDALQAEFNAHPGPMAGSSMTRISLLEVGRENLSAHSAITRSMGPLHPLLRPERLRVKNDIDALIPTDKYIDGETDISKTFGTLSISDGSIQRFLGPSATDQVLLMETFDIGDSNKEGATLSESTSADPFLSLPDEILQAADLWPFAPSYLTTPALAAQLIQHLPPLGRATALTEAYFTNLSWFCGPLDRTQAVTELLPLFYPQLRHSSHRPDPGTPIVQLAAERPLDLALLFAVFAFGAVADLTLLVDNAEVTRYNALARAALSLRNVFSGGSFIGCQAVCLLAVFQLYEGKPSSQENGWTMLSLGMSLASSIGLHRDPAGWNFDSRTCYKRRLFFWEIYFMDLWNSLETGRPSLFKLEAVDTEIPDDTPKQNTEDDGTVVCSVWDWRYRFAREVLTRISATLCSAQPTKYSEILELDRRIRDFETHPYLLRPEPEDKTGADPDFHRLHPIITASQKEWALLAVHRNFFARAMLEFPKDPLRSPFAASVLCAYRSASTLARISRYCLDKMPLILNRIWPTWSRALSCAIILATISQKGKVVSFSSSAFLELELLVDMFEKTSDLPAVKQSVPLLHRLRNQAAAALFEKASMWHQPSSSQNSYVNVNTVNDGSNILHATSFEDVDQVTQGELRVLQGATRLIERHSVVPLDAMNQRTMHHSTPSSSHSSTDSPSQTDASSPPSSFNGFGTEADDLSANHDPQGQKTTFHHTDPANIMSIDQNHVTSKNSGNSVEETFSINTLPVSLATSRPGLQSAHEQPSQDALSSLYGQLPPNSEVRTKPIQSTAFTQVTPEDADLWSWVMSESMFDPVHATVFSEQTFDPPADFNDSQNDMDLLSNNSKPPFDPQAAHSSFGAEETPTGYQTASFSPYIGNGGEGEINGNTVAEIGGLNTAAWNAFLHQNGLLNSTHGMDWEYLNTSF